ncbi:YjgN family protein [Massilia sp. Leaf139]|uniref:YjgN family protein n=1 Tax=Massilia sp. Leaf139 TaxID=1736272 RepID=UPI0006F3A7AA|nr:YjgN family protein [Massilia sp. Leaf139]KQQ96500.1 hypothetical protein ASF77_00395 [Massilia sp. Leaf139]
MSPFDTPVPVAADAFVSAFPPAAPEQRILAFGFSGSGGEYFRIWIVNLLLSVATLGIYSAWAKVRRLQYFDRNTTLGGAGFDFHGEPKPILRGRILAVVLLAAYQYAFGFSLVFGMVVAGLLLAGLPFMMRGALRFRLGHTSWRGLRFQFTGSVPLAYVSYLAPIAVFLLPGVMVALLGQTRWSLLPFALYIAWPAMFCWMKRYQFGHVAYGDQPSSADLSLGEFFEIYVRGLWMAAIPIVLVAAAAWASFSLFKSNPWLPARIIVPIFTALVPLALVLLLYLLLGPYQQVRVLNLCLRNTRFPGVRFVSMLSVRRFAWLHLKNLVFTLLTLGLYRPFAVVNVHKYRLAHMLLEVDEGFERVLADVKPAGGAVGDGAADFLGVDLSW